MLTARSSSGFLVVSLCAWAGLIGCASGGAGTASDARDGSPTAGPRPAAGGAAPATRPAKPPFVWGEAKLPRGFPPPGPIGEVVVKEYPAYRAVRVAAERVGRRDQNGMFRPLFDHISKNDIAMTAPVEMGFEPRPANGLPTAGPATAPAEVGPPVSMAFLYADPSVGRLGEEGVVEVTDLPPMTVVSVGVRGSYDAKNVAKGLEQLRRHLGEVGDRYRVAGPPRFLGYNSPMVPSFLRYGEVQIPVRVNE